MSELIQLVYASRSTFKSANDSTGIEPTVARILAKSRKNNHHAGLVGALLFADGYFLQCLEGEKSKVEALFDRLLHDKRHQDVTVLLRRPIQRVSFAEWTMKYVPLVQGLQTLLKERGYKRFRPLSLPPAVVEELIAVLHGAPQRARGSQEEDDTLRPRGAERRYAHWFFITCVGLFALAVLNALRVLG